MRFCRKEALLIVLVLLPFALSLQAWKLGEIINVQTLDGYYYPNAELMSVNDGGLTICYQNQHDETVLKGITFDKLPMEMRLRYNYDPEKFAIYQKGVGTYRPPAEPAPPKQDAKPVKTVEKAEKKANKTIEETDDTPNLTVAPWDWYYPRPKYIVRHKPHKPHKPDMKPFPKPKPIPRPGPGRPPVPRPMR